MIRGSKEIYFGKTFMFQRISFTAATADLAQQGLEALIELYGQNNFEDADVVVALGGDGFMLQTLHATNAYKLPVYGMNRGTVGFLMNAYGETDLLTRLMNAEKAEIHPLSMKVTCRNGEIHKSLAINEVSLLRAGPQASKLRISVDGRTRMEELVCDGVLLATPAGSTAYNYSAHGPILPIDAEVFALTALNAFRPRRWRGALLPQKARVTFEVLQPEKRPVRADADSKSFNDVQTVEIASERSVTHRLLFDPGHGLEERLISEQFV